MRLIIIFAILCAGSAFAEPLRVDEWAIFFDKRFHQSYIKKYGNIEFSEKKSEEDALQLMLDNKIDLAHTCSQSIYLYTEKSAIRPFQNSKIEHFNDIYVPFIRQKAFFSNNLALMVPTDWGHVTAIINVDKVNEHEITSLVQLLDPKYKGRITLNSVSYIDTFHLAFLILNIFSEEEMNDPVNIDRAADILRKFHQNGVKYHKNPAEAAQLLASGEVDIAWAYNETSTRGRKLGLKLKPIFNLKEGFSMYACGYVLNGKSNKIDQANKYVSEMLSSSNTMNIIDVTGYWHANNTSLAEKLEFVPDKEDYEALKEYENRVIWELPLKPEILAKMRLEYEKIKAGN